MENVLTQLMDVFNWIIRSSAYAVVSIAVIALAQFAGRRRLPARWLYAFWLILLVRLVLPFGPESGLSLWNLLPPAVYENGSIASAFPSDVLFITDNGKDAMADVSNAPDSNNGALKKNISLFQKNRALNSRAALSVIWLAGTLIMIAMVAANNLRLWRSLRKLRHVTDQSLLELFEDCKQLMRVRTVVGLVITDMVKSPALFGCIRPRILLPTDIIGQIPREELRFIFLHELAHFKQGDIWVGWLTALLQSLHWFNPLVWWAFARMRADREVACDALALSRMQGEDNERYGGTLIALLKHFHHSRRLPVVAGILENKVQLKRRINMITSFKHSTRREIVAAAALFAVLSIALLTSPRTLLSQSDEASETSETPIVIVGTGIQVIRDGIHVNEVRFSSGSRTDEDTDTSGVPAGIGRGGLTFLTTETSGILNSEDGEKMKALLLEKGLIKSSDLPVGGFRMTIAPGGEISGAIIDGAVPQNLAAIMGSTLPNNPATVQYTPISITDGRLYGTVYNTPTVLYEGRRYYTTAAGVSAPEVLIDKPFLLEMANAGWPADVDNVAILNIQIFINENAGIDGIKTFLGPKIPALEEELQNIQIQSPAYMDGEAVPSWIMLLFEHPKLNDRILDAIGKINNR